ncbi:putative Ig domain-containing protein [Curtobacterium sp. MCBA15_012]|uniref:putative Ig domain-containing protein n=1 Tax=Curtobacterium sp. MCBA15_012 TaxID=1898738 RepID=UPI000ACDA58E|nr:putative Ig domain-containing protein [Curtobacterium sp. MCBA15_012]WIB01309.1 putative Ig domain-containing protein [Curtobacterium sp. MCBA15_012]
MQHDDRPVPRQTATFPPGTGGTVHHSTSTTRRACALGTTVALIGLTTGLGVFTSTAAFADTTAAVSSTDPSQSTAAPTDTTTNAPAGQSSAAGATPDPSTPTGTSTSPSGASSTPSDSSTSPSTPSGTETAAPTSSDAAASDAASTASPAAPAPAATDGPTAAAVAAPTVTIVGTPTVGSTLGYVSTGFTDPIDAFWLVDGNEVGRGDTFVVPKELVGKTITLSLLGSTQEQFAQDTVVVAQALTLTTTAGQAFSRSFAVPAPSGAVTYSVGYADPSSADPTDPDDDPALRLPYDLELDATTGVLSGTPIVAGDYEFTIVATDGTTTSTQYVEITVDPAAAVGVLAYATDTSSAEYYDSIDENGDAHLTHPVKTWIIHPDGTITSSTQPADDSLEPTIVEGGNPTVARGGSLWISGELVDEFGNSTTQYDADGNRPEPTVTSDVATDQIAFDEDEYATKVTFPHASTHRLTVAQDGISVSFPVTVVPTAATVGTAPTAAMTTKGQLAFTGADETAPIAWALSLIAAGAGLAGARTIGRRRTQR